jgi:hypothetical protein
MQRTITAVMRAALVVVLLSSPGFGQLGDQAWISLFNGKSLDGWKASEHPSTFSARDGMIVAHGARSHLFYVGPVQNAEFADFEFKVDVRTKPGSNGGLYFHTAYQETNWPQKGFEVQVNNSYTIDPRKTGSLYRMQDVPDSLARDNEWFTEHIIVRGKRVVVRVDGRTVVDWTEPSVPQPPEQVPGRVLGSGTFALQGHDPGSTVYYRNIHVKPLPPLDFPIVDYHVHLKGGLTIEQAIANANRRGVRFGIAVNCGKGFPVSGDEGLLEFLEAVQGKPVYTAVQAEGREWVKLVSADVLAKFDYIFTDSMTWTNDRGERMRLWVPREVEIGDRQEFMDTLVDRTIEILTTEPIDIYVNPTYLPAEIAKEYAALWTDARMDRVIQAAVENGVAIEINSRFRLPSERFIRRAKAAGAKFSFGTNNGGADDLGQLAYSRLMARRCGLTRDDMFTPRPDGQKAIQRKGLPRR